MRHLILTILASLLGWGASCEHPTAQRQLGELQVEFQLEGLSSGSSHDLIVGEDIRLSYSLTNTTSLRQDYIIPDTGPIVTFEIRGDSLIGTSDDGLAYAQVIVDGSLQPGQTISWQYDWYSVDLHQLLLPGNYTARAVPRIDFSDVAVPVAQPIEFQVRPSTKVAITDDSPASLQNDSFQLDSVLVVGDTLLLGVTYSGGCNEHDFTVFMSPAAFLESFPVQADLFIWHEDHDDACDALIHTVLAVDLRPIADLYQQFYGRKDEIILNVYDFFENQRGRRLRVSYFPD